MQKNIENPNDGDQTDDEEFLPVPSRVKKSHNSPVQAKVAPSQSQRGNRETEKSESNSAKELEKPKARSVNKKRRKF
jgi:hypothetical protein